MVFTPKSIHFSFLFSFLFRLVTNLSWNSERVLGAEGAVINQTRSPRR